MSQRTVIQYYIMYLLVVIFVVERMLFSFTIEVEGKKNGNSYGMSRHAIFVFTACILGAD